MELSSSIPWILEMEEDFPELMDQIDMEFLYEFTTQNLASAIMVGEVFQQSCFSSSMNTTSSCASASASASASVVVFPNSHSTTNIFQQQPMPPQSNVSSEAAETSSIVKVLSLNNSNNNNNNNNSDDNTSQDPNNEDLMGIMNQQVLDGALSLSDVFISQDLATEEAAGSKSNKKKSSTIRDHIVAERKRREKLTEGFITLSSIVPGLKKIDKISVLEEAIKYMKQLQERVTACEEQQTAGKKAIESMVIVNRSHLFSAKHDDDDAAADHSSTIIGNLITSSISSEKQPLLEIEARVSEANVLIKIHCNKKQNVLVKILAELEKLNLSVVNTSVVPFGNFAFDITIIAQSENDLCVAGKDLVRSLRSALNFL